MEHRIISVEPQSIAAQAGIQADDVLLSINREEVIDEIDYQALTANEHLLLVMKRGEEEIEFDITKDDDEVLGLHFAQSMTLSPRPCHNHCIFCFIEQMPPDMRRTLYVKDDDWRFSLMMGNFITLTNVGNTEFERIIRRKASPLYISVHTTNPGLRCKMMNNPQAGNIMDRLKRLAEAGIRFHCQIVACPGYNDGEELLRTLDDLRSLYPAAQSVAIVPVGLTRFREQLTPIKPFQPETAGSLLDMVAMVQEKCYREIQSRFVFCSDEFYTLSNRSVPDEAWYEDYPQIENGVGMIRKFTQEMKDAYKLEVSLGIQKPDNTRQFWIPTGICFAKALVELVNEFAPENTKVQIVPVRNQFFGERITVTGLLTAKDILPALSSCDIHPNDAVLLSACCLRHERDLFLDDVELDDFRRVLPCPVHIIENDGFAFFDALYQRFDR